MQLPRRNIRALVCLANFNSLGPEKITLIACCIAQTAEESSEKILGFQQMVKYGIARQESLI